MSTSSRRTSLHVPSFRRATTSATVAATLGAVTLAACGRGANQSAGSAGADSTVLNAAPVGSMKPQADSALAAGKRTIDSLHQAGVTTRNGLDSVGSKVQATTQNEPNHDTSHINNRATPGAGPAAPVGGAKQP